MILKLIKSSLKDHIKKFYEELYREDKIVSDVTDSCLCKARQKVSYTLFQDMSSSLSLNLYRLKKEHRWNGFRLIAIDGSEINLPPSDELLDRFHHHHTSSTGALIPHARLSLLCDVLNKTTLDLQIDSFLIGEYELLMAQLHCVGAGDLFMGDCNYGYFHTIKKIISTGADFCMQLSPANGIVANFLDSDKHEDVVEWQPTRSSIDTCERHGVDVSPITLRLVRVRLSNNKVAVLGTSLIDKRTYSWKDINDVYWNRWGVEEEFKKYTQRLLVENISSNKTNGVLQDLYSAVCIINITAIIAFEPAEKVEKAGIKRKHKHQINWSNAIRDIRSRIVLLIKRGRDKSNEILVSVIQSIEKHTEPIREKRHYRRDKRAKGSGKKHFMCYKPLY